jgi:hypothetical protein
MSFFARLITPAMRSTGVWVSDGPLQQRGCVVGIEDGVVAREADQPGVPAEQTGREAMERPHFHRLWADHVGDAPPHLVGGLVRERERDDPCGRDSGRDQVRDPMRHHASLAAPRAC